MHLHDVMRRADKAVRAIKETHVRAVQGDRDRTDIQTLIGFFRGHEPVALLSHQPNRDVMLDLLAVGTAGFAADAVCWSNEGWHTNGEQGQINPVTGKPWRPGEMADVALNHDGLAKGWVHESLLTTVANRADDMLMVQQPYVLEGDRVRWLAPLDLDTATEGHHLHGIIPDAVRQIMAREPLEGMPAELRQALESVPYEVRAAIQDAGAASAIEQRMREAEWPVQLVIYAEPGSLRAERLRERFPQGQLIDPDQM